MKSSFIEQADIGYTSSDIYIDQIKTLANTNSAAVIEFRRHLHANPELSFKEYQTAAFVKAKLDGMGIGWEAIGETGVVAIIKGEKAGGDVIGLRADMDALPILEKNEVEYTSRNQGVMHACGHDVHTSSLLGAAYILQQLKNDFGGTVKLVFQPAEEQLPGGAVLMIKGGVLKNPAPSCMIGQHVMPFLETGKIGVRSGKHMASMDEIYVTVTGKGGHSAQPHQNIDPVLITAQLITALQQIVSRQSDPTIPSVLSFGKVIANGSVNVTPDEVYMEGTFRTMDEKWRQEAHEKMKKLAEGVAESLGGKCHFEIKKGYPYLINEEKLTTQLTGFMQDYMGPDNVVPVDMWMASEDFAYYSQAVSSCFYLLGVGNKTKGISASLHSAYFNVDEKSLEIGAGLMAYLAIKQLGN
jgi:amidohydrolase